MRSIELPGVPSEVTNASLTSAAAGPASTSSGQADTFLIYLTADGSDPDPDLDTPTEVEMTKADGIARLDFTSDAFSEGTTVKVIVRTRRSGTPNVDSSNVEIRSAIVTLIGPDPIA